jgi:hypothetical protein
LARCTNPLLKGFGVGPLSMTLFDSVVELADACAVFVLFDASALSKGIMAETSLGRRALQYKSAGN